MTIRYESTPQGVMVQVHVGAPTDAEWSAMLAFMGARKETIVAVLTLVSGDSGPTSKQRADLADTLKRMRPRLPFALLTDSSATRGILTAINWLTRKQSESRAFPLDGIEQALSFLAVSDPEKASVRALVATLSAEAPRRPKSAAS